MYFTSRSGTEEQFDEKARLLLECVALYDEFGRKPGLFRAALILKVVCLRRSLHTTRMFVFENKKAYKLFLQRLQLCNYVASGYSVRVYLSIIFRGHAADKTI